MLPLKSIQYFVPKDLREIYINLGTLKIYQPGTMAIVPRRCSFVYKGFCAYMYLSHDGHQRAFNLISDGMSFAETPSMLTDLSIPLEVICLAETQIYEIPFDQMLADMTKEQVVSLMRYTVRQNMCMHQMLGLFTSLDVTQRILLFFRIYADRYNLSGDWHTLYFKITHERLAEVVGAGRVTVTLTLNNLKLAGYIKNQGSNISFHKDIITDDFIFNGYHSIK